MASEQVGATLEPAYLSICIVSQILRPSLKEKRFGEDAQIATYAR